MASPAPTSLDLVVGYDGSEPAQRALEWAVNTLAERPGTLRVVYVSHPPTAASMTGLGWAETLDAEDEVAADVRKDVESRLSSTPVSWSFDRRTGVPADELRAAAEERAGTAPAGTSTTIVVGRSAHAVHHLIGSVPVSLLHHADLPVLTIP